MFRYRIVEPPGPRQVRFGGASRASAAEGGGALWRARPKAARPQRALRYRKVLRGCSKSERCNLCGRDPRVRRFIARPSLLASMDERAAPCPGDSRGSASGLGSERSLIGRPAKPEADKQRSKSWRCTLEAPSEAQQIRIRAAGMDRCTSKLHTADCLVRSLPACPRRRRERCSSSSPLDELLHIGWSSTSRAAQYEAHGLQLACRTCARRSGRRVCGTSASPRLPV